MIVSLSKIWCRAANTRCSLFYSRSLPQDLSIKHNYDWLGLIGLSVAEHCNTLSVWLDTTYIIELYKIKKSNLFFPSTVSGLTPLLIPGSRGTISVVYICRLNFAGNMPFTVFQLLNIYIDH